MAKNSKELTITRIFDAPLELVWKAWTDPEMYKKWWGPKDFTAPYVSIDFKVGGKYHVAMHGPAGGEFDKDLWSTGVYREIGPPNLPAGKAGKIVVTDSFADEKGNTVPGSFYGMPGTFPMETTVEIMFEEQDGKTQITLHYPTTEGIEGKMLDDMTQGWNESFDKLARLVSQVKAG